jgi:allophanate hydrolase
MKSLFISTLLEGYRKKLFSPEEIIFEVLERIERAPDHHAWITRLPREQVLGYARALCVQSADELPLYGIPFAIKDNIDLADVATTAACPAYAYTPTKSAHVVERLVAAGAIPVGKTNLDQFATGLVGIRSPYGACHNSFNRDYISGGSSSGSAVVVAQGLVSFALGTDTAGSGRVPAAFNNVIGLKPSCGLLSTRGVVPACRSLDCVSILALSSGDARQILNVASDFDAEDPFSRLVSTKHAMTAKLGSTAFTFAKPRAEQLEFFGDQQYAQLYDKACAQLTSLGGQPIEIDFEPFLAAARLLYDGPWVAERYAAVGHFIESHRTAIHPTTRAIIEKGKTPSAADAFQGQYALQGLRRTCNEIWNIADVLVTPTAGTIYTIAQVEGDPVQLNSNLGRYTNFMNLLDLAGVAVPTGFRSDGLPFGVTLVGSAGSDHALLSLGDRLHRTCATGAGVTREKLPPAAAPDVCTSNYIPIAVCGAHMEGLPLNPQLKERGAFLVKRARTVPSYRFYALPGGPPFRPGLVRVQEHGHAIEVEVWAVPSEHFGSFVAVIPAPLGIGKIQLDDNTQVSGFLCESWAVHDATDISELGGWRGYLKTHL